MFGSDFHLDVQSLGITLGGFSLKDINLRCKKGEYHILLGPTGSGKSTLLKCLLGFHQVGAGHILLKGKDITRELPERRKMGYVPQNYALFPHLNVDQNIRFGMKAFGIQKEEANAEVDKLLRLLGIEKLRSRSVQHLSGGERQKVALGRALGIRPETILLDEPFSSVDEGSKRGLWFDLKHAIEEIGVTAIHITHNLEEAETLGEQISVLINGELVQNGTRKQVFENPKSESVARFLSYRNIFKGTTSAHPSGTEINVGTYSIVVAEELPVDQRVTLCLRSQDIKIIKPDQPVKDHLKRNVFKGTITRLFPMMDHCQMWFKVDGSDSQYDFELKFPRHIMERHKLDTGKHLTVAMWEPKIIVF